MDPAGHPDDLGRLITEFTERVPGVTHALVVSSDGVPLAASAAMQPADLETPSAITSGLTSLARSAARMFGYGAVSHVLVAMERGTLVIMAIGDRASLCVLTTAADLDLVAYEMTMLAEQADGIIGSPPTDA